MKTRNSFKLKFNSSFIYLLIYLSIYLFINLFICVFIYFFVCLLIHKEVTPKMKYSESISKMLHIASILTDHIATSQLDSINCQVTGDYIIQKNTKKIKSYMEIGSKSAIFFVSYTHSQYFPFS